MKQTIEGTVVFQRSKPEGGSPDCVCCEGHHIFSRHLKADSGTNKAISVHGFLTDVLYGDNSLEGKRMRITIETVE